MTKFRCLLAVLLSVLALSGHAQLNNGMLGGANDSRSIKTSGSSDEDFTPGWKKSASSFSFNYIGRFKKAATINYDMRLSMIDVGGGYQITGEGNAWHAYLGVAQRYYINRNIYIDAAIGPSYSHSSFEYKVYDGQETYYVFNKPHYRDKYHTEKSSAGGFGLYFLPRIGLVTGKGWGINIGYMMMAPKFKFDGFFDNGSVMLGVVFGA